MADPLEGLTPATRAWFTDAFAAPTPAQEQAWAAIGRGEDTLVVAPTGSGKTLAAFLTAIDAILSAPPPPPSQRCRILYVSPLKALAADIERNLRAPLVGIAQAADRLGREIGSVTVGVRTGDTDPAERRRLTTHPPDILITTPESLFLMLTSAARESLRGVRTVIVDEIHALAGTKRGAHLAVSLARLDHLVAQAHHEPPPRGTTVNGLAVTDHEPRIQRIGLSATARPVEVIADYLRPSGRVQVIAPIITKEWDLRVIVPVADMSAPGGGAPGRGESSTDIVYDGSAAAGPRAAGIWPHVEERLVDEITRHTSTLIFVNSRRLAERLTAAVNERWRERSGNEEPLARAHHGSVSREQRAIIEDDLKSGRLPAVVATSSMELGIDMGAIDLVVQVESPPSVASGLQRVGRAGHQVGAVSRGMVFPKYRGDLLQTAVAVERMRAGAIEALRVPESPLDVLAQQVVSMVAMDDWQVGDLLELVRSCAPYRTLGEASWASVLDMLSGRYPGEEFAELRPRLVWDRTTDTLTARPGAQRLAVTSGGTIPDRGLFGVYLFGTSMRVGELDEEMVYESRVGDLFALGASSWRIEDITADRVWVSPAPGEVARMPFWRGDRAGRPLELGIAVGEFLRRIDPNTGREHLLEIGLDAYAADNLLTYLREQKECTGALPDDRTIVVERFRDELGDWRVAIHTPFGAQVHAPWALAITARLRQEHDVDAQVMYSDDGIVLRLPDTIDDATPRIVADLIAFDSEEIEGIVTAEIGGSALFAGRFRECAARALLLPRRTPGRRSPLWQQRQRSAHLLAVASRYPQFPIVAEAVREALRDVFDLPGLRTLLDSISGRRIAIVDVETSAPSPFAQSLLFDYVAEYLYDGDTPLAERRAAALTIDTGLLAELLGQTELRDLIDADALLEVTRRAGQHDRPVRDHEDVADLLRIVGPMSRRDLDDRGIPGDHVQRLVNSRRVIEVRIGGHLHWAAIEDAGVLRDALGCPLPPGIPDAFLDPGVDPLAALLARYARTHGPFTTSRIAEDFAIGRHVAERTLSDLADRGRLVRGGFTPGVQGEEWCDVDILRRARRSSIARLRDQAEPVGEHAFARFLIDWQGIALGDQTSIRGLDGVRHAIENLAGVPLPARHLDTLILPARVPDYQPSMLDHLIAGGEITWWGLAALPGDAWIALSPADLAAPLLPVPDPPPDGSLRARVLAELRDGGALFFRDLADRLERQRLQSSMKDSPLTDDDLTDALMDLVWAGQVSNDSLAPIRSRATPRRRSTSRSAPTLRRPGRLPRRSRAPRGPVRSGPPEMAGRWTALESSDVEGTMRTLATTEAMLDRYGILARAIVAGEAPTGGFSTAYRVLTTMEEAGTVQRTYAVDGLGGAQFALPGVTDRLRRANEGAETPAVVLAASDPAQPYGASLPWPERPGEGRPTRAAGAVLVLVDARPILWLDRGLASLLTWPADEATFTSAVQALLAVLDRLGPRLTLQRIDGHPLHDVPSTHSAVLALRAGGFVTTPRGLTARSTPHSSPTHPESDRARG